MYWMQYFHDYNEVGFLSHWAIALCFLNFGYLILSMGPLVVVPLIFARPIDETRLLQRLVIRFCVFLLFFLLMPPRAGDFYSNGGTDDLLLIHFPVMCFMSLCPDSFNWFTAFPWFSTPQAFRCLRRAAWGALYAGWMGGSGYLGSQVRLWDWTLTVIFFATSFSPRLVRLVTRNRA